MELLYLTDISQVKFILENRPQLFKELMPITGDIVVAYELENLKIKFIDEWDYLDPIEIEENWNLAYELSESWLNEININENNNEFYLSKETVQELVLPFEACLNAKTVYNKIFKKYSIEQINGFFLPQVPIIRNGPPPAHRAIRSVVEAVIFWLAEVNQIQITKLEERYSLSDGKLNKRRNVRELDFLKSKSNYEKIVLIKYDTLSGDEYRIIRDCFNKLPDWDFIPITNLQLEQMIPSKRARAEKNHQFKDVFEKYIKSYKGGFPEIFANKYLSFQFECVWNEIDKSKNLGEIFSTFLDILNPEIVIFGHEAFAIERHLVNLAKQRNIYTIGLFHEGLCIKSAYRGLAGNTDSILLWNDYGVEIMESFGIEKSRLQKIGNLRYANKFEKYVNLQNAPINRRDDKKRKLGLSDKKPVILLVTAAINTDFCGIWAHPGKHRKAYNDLFCLISRRKDLQFIIKSHPTYDHYELYRKLNHMHLPNLKFIENITIDEVIEVSDVCFMINYFTTAALEAMLGRVPVLYLDNAVYPLKDWKVVYDNINRVHSITELESKIDLLLTEPNTRKHSFIQADSFILKVLDISEKSANERFIDFVKKTKVIEKESEIDSIKIVLNILTNKSSSGNNQEVINVFLNDIILKHSIEHVLVVFSYLAGTYNLGIKSIYRLINNYKIYFEKDIIPSLNIIRWPLFRAYIAGYNENSLKTDFCSIMHIVGLILHNPKQFMFMSLAAKWQIFKYFVKATFRNYSFTKNLQIKL